MTIPAGARIHSNQNWYKLAGNRVLLTARHESSDMVQRTVIKENPNATDGFDLKFDSRFMAGYAPMFYSMADDENYLLIPYPSSIIKQPSHCNL